ncbi:MAG: exosortase/archaeosortase family protein, partial [Planctomycetes bacterium]|nr:exosortase/archaeosortase family protein [Planctomycetota bacterium]
ACGGLRMLIAFVIVTAFIAYMIRRSRWYKAVVLVSSIPVAVACNILRIFLTAMIMLHVSVEIGEKFFHDFAGLVMMPAAVSLILTEIGFLDRIVKPARPQKRRQEATVIARSVRRAAAGSSGA